MTNQEIESVLVGALSLGTAADPELRLIHTALLIEDVFGIALSDDEINQATLGEVSAICALLDRRGVGY